MREVRGPRRAGTDVVLIAALREGLAEAPVRRSHICSPMTSTGAVSTAATSATAGPRRETTTRGLVAAGVTMHIMEATRDGNILFVPLSVGSPDPGELPPELTVRLSLRDGLVADLRELDPPPTIELLYFDGRPHHETFLAHLRQLLDEHGITAPVTLVRNRQ